MLNKIKNFIINHFNLSVFLILTIVVFSLYGKTLFFDWNGSLDDDNLILDRQNYLKFSNIRNIFTDSFFGNKGDFSYRPILNCSFMIDRYLYGTNHFGYNVTNLLIFLLDIFLVFLLFRRDCKLKNIYLLFLCLTLAVHPMLLTTLSKISDRSDSLLVLFTLLSIIFLKKYLYTNKVYYLIIHIALFIISLFVKETAVVIPIIFFSYMFIFKQFYKKNIVVLIFQSVSVLFFLICRGLVIQNYDNGLSTQQYIYILKNILISSKYLIKYFYNLIFPITFQVSFINSILLLILTILFFLLIIYKYKYKNIKLNIFIAISFVLFLLPTMSAVVAVYSPPRIFLPMICVLYLLFDILYRYQINKKIIYVFFSIFVIFFVISFNSLDKFQNKWTYYVYLLQENPKDAFVNAKFASMLVDIKMYDEAILRYCNAIELDKYNYNHYNNLAVVYMKKREFKKAKNLLLIAKNLKDDDENVNYNLQQIKKYLNENE